MANTSAYEFTPLFDGGRAGPVGLDPRLQKLLALRQRGTTKPATATTAAGEVAVVAKVTDVDAWEQLSEVHPGTTIGGTADDGTIIVTARVPVARIEVVRAQPFVVSMKPAQRLSSRMDATVREILARSTDLPAGNQVNGGKGVLVGITDIGCDFAHRDFLTPTNRTRLLKIWDQNGHGSGDGHFDYGRVHTATRINAALGAADPYRALGYGPDPSEPAHGTHVMGIAAGNGRGSGLPGVAPAADLVFVDVANSDIPWSGPEAVGKSFGDSVQLLEALAFVFETAATRPCVVNVSLGTNGGPHDGTTLVEQGIDRLLRQAPNRAVVIAASNSFADGIHAAGTVPKTGGHALGWIVAPGDATDNELEIWYPGGSSLSVELVDPAGKSLGVVGPGQSGTVSSRGRPVVFVANRLKDPNNGDNMIGVFLAPSSKAGTWTVRLRAVTSKPVPFHAWIERDDAGQSTFGEPLDNTHTIGSISCGHDTIVVGSYDAHKATKPLSWFSSAGPTRDGRHKPEVSAPGHNVRAAASGTVDGTTRMSGTSMASPAVTGTVALVLAEARARKISLTIDEVRALVIGAARRTPPPGTAWDPRYGFGRISAAGAVAKVAAVKRPKPPGTAKAAGTATEKAAAGKVASSGKATTRQPARGGGRARAPRAPGGASA